MTTITPTIAAHVLHHFGEGGIRAGSFTVRLVDLIAHADPGNQTRLGLGFPGYVHAVYIAQNRETGIAELRAIAAQERLEDAPISAEITLAEALTSRSIDEARMGGVVFDHRLDDAT